MKGSDVTELLNDLERKFSVEKWSMQGIRIWPYIRINLTFALFRADIATGEKNSNKQSKWINIFKSEVNSVRGFAKYIHAYMADYRKNSRPSQHADCVFLSDGVPSNLINGYQFNVFSDPFIRHIKNRQLSFFSMTTQHTYLTPRHNPSMFIQSKLDFLRIKNAFLRKGVDESNENLIGFDDFIRYLKDNNLPLPVPDIRTLRGQISTIRVFADFYIKILKAVRPSIVFLVCYYSNDGFALTLACRELGIQCIDIQHGFQGEFHPAYGRWNKVPETGFELLPSLFWCWSESEADAIRQWSSTVSKYHKPIVGGNLWLAEWQGDNDFVLYFDGLINSIKESKPAAVNILVTPLPDDRHGFEIIMQAMRLSDPSWRWWIRLHPGQVDKKQAMEQLLDAHGIKGYELDSATDLPLYALLRHMDIHITQFSSVVIEAESFGVPSIITTKYGEEMFPGQIKTGWAVAAYSSEEIINSIRLQLSHRNSLKESKITIGSSVDNGLAFLFSLIEENRNKRVSGNEE